MLATIYDINATSNSVLSYVINLTTLNNEILANTITIPTSNTTANIAFTPKPVFPKSELKTIFTSAESLFEI